MSYEGEPSSKYADYRQMSQANPSRHYRSSSISSYDSPLERQEYEYSRYDRHQDQRGYSNHAMMNGGPSDPSPSDRGESEYTVRNEAVAYGQPWEYDDHRAASYEDHRAASYDDHRAASRTASEIYAATRFPPTRSDVSQYTYKEPTGHSDIVSVKTKTTRDGKLVMETMTAPHPCCPNTKSVCCLMILLNLSLMLICLGFIVVLQLSDPPYIWYFGIAMLVVGFLVLFGSLIYCVVVCREVEHLRSPTGDIYWTNHWTKSVNFPEIHYSNTQYKPYDYKGSEYSFKTEPSRTTTQATSQTRY